MSDPGLLRNIDTLSTVWAGCYVMSCSGLADRKTCNDRVGLGLIKRATA